MALATYAVCNCFSRSGSAPTAVRAVALRRVIVATKAKPRPSARTLGLASVHADLIQRFDAALAQSSEHYRKHEQFASLRELTISYGHSRLGAGDSTLPEVAGAGKLLVPTLSIGDRGEAARVIRHCPGGSTPGGGYCVFLRSPRPNGERGQLRRHSHAERGNEGDFPLPAREARDRSPVQYWVMHSQFTNPLSRIQSQQVPGRQHAALEI